MSVGQEFWIVAAGYQSIQSGDSDKRAFLQALKSSPSIASKGQGGADCPWQFQVPDGDRSLLFGSFDNLIRLTDDLTKADMQVDSLVHRVERQYVELDPKADFKVKSQRQEKSLLDYLKNWTWDEAKYPKTRSILDNLTLLLSVVNKLDEEARNKTAQYNEFKTQRGNLAKKEGANLTNRDLVDVLVPGTVKINGTPDDDMIYTNHLTTIMVIVARGYENEFTSSYESFADSVVPLSARKFQGHDDKDGNSLWRVVVMKEGADQFKKTCRERRFVTRDFEYSEDAYKRLVEHRQKLDDAVKQQHELLRGLYQAAWSDTMVAWMHIKAMRVFVESVLRFGMPPRCAAYIVSPKSSNAPAARKALADILGKGSAGVHDKNDAQDDEEYFPYVSVSFTPFTMQR